MAPPIKGNQEREKESVMAMSTHGDCGSLSSMLHGKKGRGQGGIRLRYSAKNRCWSTRNIARVHAENGGKLVHGNNHNEDNADLGWFSQNLDSKLKEIMAS